VFSIRDAMTFGQHGVIATTDVGQMKRAQPTGYGLLWFGPFALLAGGAAIAFLMARQQRLKSGVVQPLMSEAEQKRADALRRGDDDKPKFRDKN
jgi:Cytochrome C biogenesis protein